MVSIPLLGELKLRRPVSNGLLRVTPDPLFIRKVTWCVELLIVLLLAVMVCSPVQFISSTYKSVVVLVGVAFVVKVPAV